MRALFVCSRNKLRSPTAEAVFATWDGVEALSAGVNPDAVTPVDADLLEWADLVFVMEAMHKRKLERRFGALLREKRVVVLAIPDDYACMDPELVRLLVAKAGSWLRPPG
ncbi:MAG: phosphotyrosine protein phosphatase [Planctomycetes bacterium]|nr:phosphotyrosine protein phosphatase [Planctomycetota bacterium]